jgi:hypothetical protein
MFTGFQAGPYTSIVCLILELVVHCFISCFSVSFGLVAPWRKVILLGDGLLRILCICILVKMFVVLEDTLFCMCLILTLNAVLCSDYAQKELYHMESSLF